MSKREFKKYIHELDKESLEEQVLDLYDRFKEVKTYYDFVFNPQEEKRLEDAKLKISKEYFPINGRKAKKRRSVAQKMIKHFKTLGVESHVIAELMLYNIELAITFSGENRVNQEAFYKSIFKSFEEYITFSIQNAVFQLFDNRIDEVLTEVKKQDWFNSHAFEMAFHRATRSLEN